MSVDLFKCYTLGLETVKQKERSSFPVFQTCPFLFVPPSSFRLFPFRMRATPCPLLWKQDTRTLQCYSTHTSTSLKPSHRYGLYTPSHLTSPLSTPYVRPSCCNDASLLQGTPRLGRKTSPSPTRRSMFD